jgi:hypothetical protein
MAKESVLSKLKGYKRTFVVHSEANPYAAVAAMAIQMGRNSERGRFFRFSEALIPPAPRTDTPADPPESKQNELIANFTNDWAEYLYQHALPACGVKIRRKRSLNDDTLRYLNAYGRRIPAPKPRTVHESRELSVPNEYQPAYEALKRLITSGADLRPYLSRDILKKKRPDRNDGLLNAWGIQHLHFEETGTTHILFCRITESHVFMIQALPHDDDQVWVDTTLLQILHNNWPEELSFGKPRGLVPEVHPTAKRHTLRRQNANFITTMTDGTVYLAPGGGQMASGDSPEDLAMCDSIFSELKELQELVTTNVPSIRSALNWSQNKKLSIKMMFGHRDYCIYEPTTRIRLRLPDDNADT